MDTKLVEMIRGLLAPTNQQSPQILQEMVELLDARSKARLRDYLCTKTLATLKQQKSAIEDAIKRYGSVE